MFAYFYEWIRNIAFYMILTTVLLEALPACTYQKYIRFFTGLILVLLLMTPIWNLFGMARPLDSVFDSRAYEREVERMEESMERMRKVEEEYLEQVREQQYGSENGVEASGD